MYQHLKNTLEHAPGEQWSKLSASVKFKHQHFHPQGFNGTTQLRVQGVNSYNIPQAMGSSSTSPLVQDIDEYSNETTGKDKFHSSCSETCGRFFNLFFMLQLQLQKVIGLNSNISLREAESVKNRENRVSIICCPHLQAGGFEDRMKT